MKSALKSPRCARVPNTGSVESCGRLESPIGTGPTPHRYESHANSLRIFSSARHSRGSTDGQIRGFFVHHNPLMNRPAFQFYPADWRKDLGLQACSMAAKGLWIDLLCIMHESENYGFLEISGAKTNQKPSGFESKMNQKRIKIDSKLIGKLVGLSENKAAKLIAELEENGVFSRDEDGIIYCRRMVKDERIRSIRAEAGKQGGNPLLVKQTKAGLVKQTDSVCLTSSANITPPPSSSSSSSTSVKKDIETPAVDDGAILFPEEFPEARPYPTLAQAIEYGKTLKISERAAKFWWEVRDSAGWTKSQSGGGVARKITGWQSDMAVSVAWAEKGGHDRERSLNGKTPQPEHRKAKAAREFAETEPDTIRIIS